MSCFESLINGFDGVPLSRIFCYKLNESQTSLCEAQGTVVNLLTSVKIPMDPMELAMDSVK